MNYSIRGKTLELRSGKKAEFQYRIHDAVEIDDVTIVCLEVPLNRRLNENVYALDGQGNLLWQVKPMNHVPENSPFIGVERAGQLARLFNWDGKVYDINPKTGDIVSSYWGK